MKNYSGFKDSDQLGLFSDKFSTDLHKTRLKTFWIVSRLFGFRIDSELIRIGSGTDFGLAVVYLSGFPKKYTLACVASLKKYFYLLWPKYMLKLESFSGKSFRLKFIPNQSDLFRNLFPRQSELIRVNPKKVFNPV